MKAFETMVYKWIFFKKNWKLKLNVTQNSIWAVFALNIFQIIIKHNKTYRAFIHTHSMSHKEVIPATKTKLKKTMDNSVTSESVAEKKWPPYYLE